MEQDKIVATGLSLLHAIPVQETLPQPQPKEFVADELENFLLSLQPVVSMSHYCQTVYVMCSFWGKTAWLPAKVCVQVAVCYVSHAAAAITVGVALHCLYGAALHCLYGAALDTL